MALSAAYGKVIVLADEPVTQTASGLYIPELATRRTSRGTVISANIESFSITASSGSDQLLAGSIVIYKPGVGYPLEYQGVKYMIIDVVDLLAREV